MTAPELARYEAGLSITDAAEKAGVSIRTVARAEAGQRISAPAAKALADTYEVSVARFLGLPDPNDTEATV